jgi:hypothetical protein
LQEKPEEERELEVEGEIHRKGVRS